MIQSWILVTPPLRANLLIALLDTSSFGFFLPLRLNKPLVTSFCQSVSLYKYKVKTEYKDKVNT